MGGPGCGKTVFALQTLVNGARDRRRRRACSSRSRRARAQIVANAATFGWDLPALEKKKLFFLDARLSPEVVKAGEFDLVGMLAPARGQGQGDLSAKRIVFDGIDVLLGLLDDPVAERREIYRIRDWLRRHGLDRHHHAEGRRATSRPPLQLPAVHGRLRRRAPASGRRRIGVPQSARR